MSRFTFIVNPLAGKGGSARLPAVISRAMKSRGVPYEIRLTEYPGHAMQLARSSASPVVVAVGGDGTVNEVANGLIGTDRVLGIIPAGSGNDLIKSVNIPAKAADAMEVLFSGRTRAIDVGTVQCRPDSNHIARRSIPEGRCFVNGVGVGFDAAVAARTREIKYLTGTMLYAAAVFQTLGRYDSPPFTVVVDGTPRTSRYLLMAIGNGRCAGGGFYLTPEAVVDDGLFDVCVIEKASVPRILLLMPSVMVGKHQKAREVSFTRGKQIRIFSEARFYVHADGEIVGRDTNEVRIGMAEFKLPVLVGR